MPRSVREARAIVVVARQAERFAAETSARTSWNGGEAIRVMIEDVSTSGLRLRTSFVAPPQTLLRVGLRNGRAPHARVVWCKAGRIGCEFTRPLSEADLAELLSLLDPAPRA